MLTFAVQRWGWWSENDTLLSFSGSMPDPKSCIPAAYRRRLSEVAKASVTLAYALSGDKETKTIFCSRHGHFSKNMDMLFDVYQKEPVSPTVFSLSVHNALSGMMHIIQGNQLPSSAVDSFSGVIESTVIDSVAALDADEQVLLVYFEEAFDERLSQFESFNAESGKKPCVLAMLLSPVSKTTPDTLIYKLQPEVLTKKDATPVETDYVEKIKAFLMQRNEVITLHYGRISWSWIAG